MFASNGYKEMIKQMKSSFELECENIDLICDSHDKFLDFRGRAKIIRNMLGFEDSVDRTIEQMKEMIAEEEAESDEQEITL